MERSRKRGLKRRHAAFAFLRLSAHHKLLFPHPEFPHPLPHGPTITVRGSIQRHMHAMNPLLWYLMHWWNQGSLHSPLDTLQVRLELPLLQLQAVGLGLDKHLLGASLSFKGLAAESWRPSTLEEGHVAEGLYSVKLTAGPVLVKISCPLSLIHHYT